ncbi:MAG TPA: hypothetical protein VGP88_08485, partial [Thermoplasmata archaeon]|nr:hypothetical protein [Thermoplasmata archaeon]
TGRLVPLRPVLDRYGPDALRFYLLAPLYRDRLEWNGAALRSRAREADWIHRTLHGAIPAGAGGGAPLRALLAADRAIRKALLDGLRIGDAFEELEGLARAVEADGRGQFPKGDTRVVRATLRGIDRRLGLGLAAAAVRPTGRR